MCLLRSAALQLAVSASAVAAAAAAVLTEVLFVLPEIIFDSVSRAALRRGRCRRSDPPNRAVGCCDGDAPQVRGGEDADSGIVAPCDLR